MANTFVFIVTDMSAVETRFNVSSTFKLPSVTGAFITFKDKDDNEFAWSSFDISHIELRKEV